MTRRALVAAGSVCAAVLLIAGCGSDDDPAPVSTTAKSTTGVSTNGASTPTATSVPPSLPPPYIAGADWVQTDVGASLQIRPTRNGRDVQGDAVADEAWNEVLALHPDADTPGMRAQFDCHWTFARLVDPDKPSWNLEPSRPVVSTSEMISSRCNPGAAEESP